MAYKQSENLKKLTSKIQQLNSDLKQHPARDRKKADERNRETLLVVLLVITLTGILIFGAGWLAVALLGTALPIIIVESGLFLSVAVGFSSGFLHKAYIGIRDLFASEKIKNQNKDYDSLQKRLVNIKKLLFVETVLSGKIDTQLNEVIQLTAIKQRNPDFLNLSLKDQISQLKEGKQNHPAYERKLKDKKNWFKLIRYAGITSIMAVCTSFISILMGGGLSFFPLLIGPVFPAVAMIESMLILILIAPIAVSSLLYGSYLLVRDIFSPPKIKAENKEYAQLEKIIDKLDKLSRQQDALDLIIENQLHEPGTRNATTEVDNKLSDKNQAQITDSGKMQYSLLFTTSANEANKTDLSSGRDCTAGKTFKR
jgi:hypothetical protein